MPGFNQKGPMGEGPMTGRKMGKCTDFGTKNSSSSEETINENFVRGGRGFGMRRGLGFGQNRAVQDFEETEGRGLGQGRGFRCRGARMRLGRGRGNGRFNDNFKIK